MMKKHPVVWFSALAFGISWIGWLPAVLGSHGIAPFDEPVLGVLLVLPAIGPAAAAAVVARATRVAESRGGVLQPLVRWRVPAVWYAAGTLGPVALLFSARLVTSVVGGAQLRVPESGNTLPVAASAFAMSLLANPWEEVGWRGFALPRLQERHTALVASLIVGVMWGLWHLPLFFWKGNPMATYPFVAWFVGTIAASVIYTWLYNSARGSLVPVAVFHVCMNTAGVLVPGVSVRALALAQVLAACVLVAALGAADLSRTPRVRAT